MKYPHQAFQQTNKELEREELRDKRLMPILPKIPSLQNYSGNHQNSHRGYNDQGFGDRFQRYGDEEMGSLLKPIDWSKTELLSFQKDFYQVKNINLT